jgi:hypothetical protein
MPTLCATKANPQIAAVSRSRMSALKTLLRRGKAPDLRSHIPDPKRVFSSHRSLFAIYKLLLLSVRVETGFGFNVNMREVKEERLKGKGERLKRKKWGRSRFARAFPLNL